MSSTSLVLFFGGFFAVIALLSITPQAEAVTLSIKNPYPGARFPLASSPSEEYDDDELALEDSDDEAILENYDDDEDSEDGLSRRYIIGVLPTECDDVKWKDYVGADARLGNDPRPCFSPTPKKLTGQTIEKRAAQFYRKNLVTTTYAKLALIYASEVSYSVPWFGVKVTGEEALIIHSELGNTGERYAIVDQQFNRRIIQDGRHLVAFVDIYYHIYASNTTWKTMAIWYMYFNKHHEIEQLDIFVDTLGTATNIGGAGNVQFNHTKMCINYFAWCTGENKYFTDFEECHDYYASLPPNNGHTPLQGKHIACNYGYLVLAQDNPSPNCRHASNLKLDPELDPCQDW